MPANENLHPKAEAAAHAFTEHPDTSKLFKTKTPKKGLMPVPLDLEDDIQLSVRTGMMNVT